MVTSNAQGLIEGVESLVITQPADKSPPRTTSITLEVSSIDLSHPDCDYDEYLTEPVVNKLWNRFTIHLKRDQTGCHAFESLLQSIQSKYTSAISALETETKKYEAKYEKIKAKYKAALLSLQNTSRATVEEKNKMRYLVRQAKMHAENPSAATPNGLLGSVSRSTAWKRVKSNESNKIDHEFVRFAEGEEISNSRVQHLVDRRFSHEKQMYLPVMRLMKELFNRSPEDGHQGVAVFDTHKNGFLNGLAPDIAITLGNIKEVDKMSVYCVVELKAGKIDDTAFGQTLEYLFALRQIQPDRPCIAALLSNLKQNYIVILRMRGGDDFNIVQYNSVSLAQALTFIKTVVLVQPMYFPAVPAFSAELGVMKRRLGNPHHSAIGEFKIPRSIAHGSGKPTLTAVPKTMAVKRAAVHMPSADDIENEISLLEVIRDGGGCHYLPELIYVAEDRKEFGIIPVGQSIDRNASWKHQDLRQILAEVLSGMQWLHSQNIIHRDIRWDNIIITEDRACLIDLGNSIRWDGKPTEYAGGYVCCPVSLIGDMNKTYIPQFADDYMAFLLLISLLMFPTSGRGLTTTNLMVDSDDSERVKEFWKEMRQSKFWGRYVKAAEKADGKIFAELFEVFLML